MCLQIRRWAVWYPQLVLPRTVQLLTFFRLVYFFYMCQLNIHNNFRYIREGETVVSTNAQIGIVGSAGPHCSTSSLFDRAQASSLLLSQRIDKTLLETYKHKEKEASIFNLTKCADGR